MNGDELIQACTLLLEHRTLYDILASFDVIELPPGYFVAERGTEEVRQARIARRCVHAVHSAFQRSRPPSDFGSIRLPLVAQRAFLVAFGGRRRPGDIIDHLGAYIRAQNWICAPIICVLDLVHGEHHDAAKGAAVGWCRAILCGLCIGVLASPPCETWTLARHNEEGDAFVVPVRSESHPWGLPGLTRL